MTYDEEMRAALLSDIDRELQGPPGSPDNRRKLLRRARLALSRPVDADVERDDAALYNSLKPEQHGLERFPPPDDCGEKPSGDERFAECIAYGGDWTREGDVEKQVLFAIKLGRALAAHPHPDRSAEVETLRDHIAEQITHVEHRIKDGAEMGAAVWRIALEDVVRENRAALASLPEPGK